MHNQQLYDPGPHVRSVFQPLPVPSIHSYDAQVQTRLQEIIFACRWCTFHRAKRYFSSLIKAATCDLFLSLDIPLSAHDQFRLESFLAQSPPVSPSTFEATAYDGSHISLEYPRRLVIAILMTYRGLDSRFDERFKSNLTISPMSVLTIPEHLLIGRPRWTREKVDFLQMLCSYVDLRLVRYELSAFHEGIKSAVVQENHEALLVLLWQAVRRYETITAHDEGPLELPAELFQLVARRGVLSLAATSDRYSSSEAMIDDTLISRKLFTLLLRAHAESMPREDPDIIAWATDLLKCNENAKNDHADFAQWVLDWGGQKRNSEYVFERSRFTSRRGEQVEVRRPLFRGGIVSRKWMRSEMAKRFVEICGGRVESFEEEAARVGRARVSAAEEV